MTQKQFVQKERQYTITLLKGLKSEKWQAQTLCDGWSVEDLAAHLVSRERNVIGGLGLVVASLQGLHDKRIAKEVTHGHKYIIEKLEKYPWYIPATINTAEFWVHNEDMLRGELKMSRSAPTKVENEILWGSLASLVKIKKGLVADLGNVRFINTETKQELVTQQKNSNKKTTISGTAGELLLYFYGRRKSADVIIDHNG